jgi:hypothetical protein
MSHIDTRDLALTPLQAVLYRHQPIFSSKQQPLSTTGHNYRSTTPHAYALHSPNRNRFTYFNPPKLVSCHNLPPHTSASVERRPKRDGCIMSFDTAAAAAAGRASRARPTRERGAVLVHIQKAPRNGVSRRATSRCFKG